LASQHYNVHYILQIKNDFLTKGKLNVKTFINGVLRTLITKHFILDESEYRYLTNIGHYHDCND